MLSFLLASLIAAPPAPTEPAQAVMAIIRWTGCLESESRAVAGGTITNERVAAIMAACRPLESEFEAHALREFGEQQGATVVADQRRLREREVRTILSGSQVRSNDTPFRELGGCVAEQAFGLVELHLVGDALVAAVMERCADVASRAWSLTEAAVGRDEAERLRALLDPQIRGTILEVAASVRSGRNPLLPRQAQSRK
jgi:hypothetical protein